MSSRFAPLSYEKPKALLKVKGEVLIEREIRQLQAAGIDDITVVVGYMKEKLFYLEDRFHVKIVINEDYHRYNNPSTLMLVRDRLKNTFICSSDNYFEQNPFEPYVYQAYYAALYSAGKTDEYCMVTNRKGRITGVQVGGSDAWYMIGHAYFDRSFSEKFTQILEREYDSPVTRAGLWEDLYARHIRELEMYIRKYPGGIHEFDSLDELRAFDSAYVTNADSYIFDNICAVLHCAPDSIHGIIPIKTGLTNLSFKFTCNGRDYVYRHPGAGTETYIDRPAEARAMEAAKALGLDDKIALLRTRPHLYVTVYSMADLVGYFYGALAVSTGYVSRFDLHPYYKGFRMALPQRTDPTKLEELVPQDKMFEVFSEYTCWVDVIGVANIALHTREKTIDVLESDYVRFARARGLSTWGALRHHGIHAKGDLKDSQGILFFRLVIILQINQAIGKQGPVAKN